MKKNVIPGILLVALFTLGFAKGQSSKNVTILVLPFQNSSDPSNSWVSVGIAATVISDLSRISGVSVISELERQNAMKELSLSMTGLLEENRALQVGKMLAADAILSGNVLVVGENLRVNTTLVNVKTGTLINAVKLDGTLPQIFQLQDKIVSNLLNDTKKLESASVVIGEIKQVQNRPNLNAFEWYAKALNLLQSKEKGSNLAALECVNKAIEIDPAYIDARELAGLIYDEIAFLNNLNADLSLGSAEGLYRDNNEIGTAKYAGLLKEIGNVEYHGGNLQNALRSYLKSKSILDSLNLQNTRQYYHLLKDICKLYLEKGDSSICLDYHLKRKHLYESYGLQNTTDYLNVLLDIAITYWNNKRLDQALDYLLKCSTVYKSLGNRDTIDRYHAEELNAKFGNNASWIFGDKDEALIEHSKLGWNGKTPICPYDFQNTYGYSMLMECIGYIYNSKGFSDQALLYYLKSEAIRKSSGFQNTYGYGEVSYSIGLLYANKKNEILALQFFRNALDIFAKVTIMVHS